MQISNGGGSQPQLRPDGRDLFYIARDGKLMALDVKLAPQFQLGIRLAFHYDVAPDGQRFLFNAPRLRKRPARNDPGGVELVWRD